jgi:hypothetical protein
MALPIAATPVLKGEAAKKFFAKIDSDLQTPSRLVATPNLNKARDLIKEYADKRGQK